MRARDIADMLLLGAIWGGSFPLLRLATPEFGPVALVAVRLLCAAGVALFVWKVMAGIRRHWRRLAVLGFLNTAAPFTLFAVASLYIPSGVNSLLNATVPIFGALLAWRWLGERLDAPRVVGIVVAFAGVAAIVAESVLPQGLAQPSAGTLLGVAAGLAGAACYAAAVCYTRKYFADTPATLLTAGSVALAALYTLPAAAWALPPALPSAGAWLAALALG
ncbi:MAG: DMT family transporter, partial [Steroidobacteraceae bacterium]|nr:DMT family transporter [Steroidobacteraceae bacterium]